jgi:imidazolonepropionase-like amidohydrolase
VRRVLLVLVFAGCSGRTDLVESPRPLPAETLIRNVAILDVESGERTAGHDVIVRGGRIVGIAATGTHESSRGTTLIDGAGATLLPGLVDLHAHPGTSPAPDSGLPNAAANLRAYLYCGVTTVVDLGGLGTRPFERRLAASKGELLSPTLYVAGPVVTAPGGHPVAILRVVLPWWFRGYAIPRFTIQVGTPGEAAAAAALVADEGADLLKVVVDRIPPDAPRIGQASLEALVQAAFEHGLRTWAHVGTTQDALDAARAGASIWAHGIYREPIAEEHIPELARFGIPMIPTIVVFEALSQPGQRAHRSTRLERETVPAEVLASFNARPDSEAERAAVERARALSRWRQDWRDNVRRLHDAGVTILAGSDMQSGVFPGPGLHRELGHLHEAGLTNLEAIRAATLDAARFLEQRPDPSFGLVAVGKRADLLLVEGDPRESLSHLERIRAVIVRGVAVERRAISP